MFRYYRCTIITFIANGAGPTAVRRDGGCVVCTVVTVQRTVFPPSVCVLLTSPQPRCREAANKHYQNPRKKEKIKIPHDCGITFFRTCCHTSFGVYGGSPIWLHPAGTNAPRWLAISNGEGLSPPITVKYVLTQFNGMY